MQVEVITKDDLQIFRRQLLDDIRHLLKIGESVPRKEWLRSSEVRKILKISAGTLQNQRITGQLSPTKVNGIYFYKLTDVNKMLESDLSTHKRAT